jgi:hypothetical protein
VGAATVDAKVASLRDSQYVPGNIPANFMQEPIAAKENKRVLAEQQKQQQNIDKINAEQRKIGMAVGALGGIKAELGAMKAAKAEAIESCGDSYKGISNATLMRLVEPIMDTSGTTEAKERNKASIELISQYDADLKAGKVTPEQRAKMADLVTPIIDNGKFIADNAKQKITADNPQWAFDNAKNIAKAAQTGMAFSDIASADPALASHIFGGDPKACADCIETLSNATVAADRARGAFFPILPKEVGYAQYMKNSSNDMITAQATADKLTEMSNTAESSFAKAKEVRLPKITAAFEKLKAPEPIKLNALIEQERAANGKNRDKVPGLNSLTKAFEPPKNVIGGKTA